MVEEVSEESSILSLTESEKKLVEMDYLEEDITNLITTKKPEKEKVK